mmetsp:Transcript_5679/g.12380  ORF Transcript_5679/g.12380 Transcript_5679/m.12380 type:complete len:116 (+) Transcript_5679:38-385(+)
MVAACYDQTSQTFTGTTPSKKHSPSSVHLTRTANVFTPDRTTSSSTSANTGHFSRQALTLLQSDRFTMKSTTGVTSSLSWDCKFLRCLQARSETTVLPSNFCPRVFPHGKSAARW